MHYSYDRVKQIINKHIKVDCIEFVGSGNHCEAFCINKDIVVKMPKHKTASECLKKEIKVLNALQNKLPLEIPNVLFVCEVTQGNQQFVCYASKKLSGKKLTRQQFLSLRDEDREIAANIIAKFLFILHNQKDVFDIKRKDFCLLHGDFSLNHILFDDKNRPCGILDFGDSRVGKYKSDFVYLLDDEDDEEFGIDFGLKVLKQYEKQ